MIRLTTLMFDITDNSDNYSLTVASLSADLVSIDSSKVCASLDTEPKSSCNDLDSAESCFLTD